MTLSPDVVSARRLPDVGTPGVADARVLPDLDFDVAWTSVHLPDDVKGRLLRTTVAGIQLRHEVSFTTLPLHGVALLTGRPGVGKTTLARGLATRVAQAVPSAGAWAFIEIDPHALTSHALGRSQRSVEQLFGTLLHEHADAGPLVVLLDEVETLMTDRAGLSMEANPIDVHRAVDAALVGLDRLARAHRNVVIVATSNFSEAIDPALESRADTIIEVPLPDATARRSILSDTVAAVAAQFSGARRLLEASVLDAAAAAAEGLDGRQLRKAIVAACARRPAANGDPNSVTGEDLLAVLTELRNRA